MRVNDPLRMELIDKCLWKWPTFFLNAGEAMKPQPINKLTTVAFRAFKIFGTSSEGNCNLELISA